MRVDEIMNCDVFALREGDAIDEALERFLELGITSAPVLDPSGKPIGVLSLREVLAKKDGCAVVDRMTRRTLSIRAEWTIDDAARRMAECGLDYATVVDREGFAVGVLSLAEALKTLRGVKAVKVTGYLRNGAIGLAVSFLLLACGGHSEDTPVETLEAEIASARLETGIHRHEAAGAASMPAMMDELERYEGRMSTITVGMHHSIEDGSHCSGMSRVGSMMGPLGDELERHHENIERGSGIDAAHMETERHATAMFEMLDVMRGEVGTMSCMGFGMHM